MGSTTEYLAFIIKNLFYNIYKLYPIKVKLNFYDCILPAPKIPIRLLIIAPIAKGCPYSCNCGIKEATNKIPTATNEPY
ncbi:MAG: hypothetical protein QOK71_10395 [Nitrososphaeraceae archaeon]|nr:hypothetical protein [Nitrososphaeraceae archaeon]